MNPLFSTNPAEQGLQELHNFYTAATGRTEKYVFWQTYWLEWSKYFDKADLEVVLRHILKINRDREKRYQISLSLRSILDPQTFDSLRADSEVERKAMEARKRKLSCSEGQKQLAQMRGEAVPEPTNPELKVRDTALMIMLRKAAQ